MTPKDKAEYLLGKYGKDYALFCVKNLIQIGNESGVREPMMYWQKVKQEIEMKTPCSNHEMDEPTFDDLAYSVKLWAESRDLIKKENVSRQMLKVMEEVGETAASIARGDKRLIKDGIGDSFVTLIILAWQNNIDPTECLRAAWEEIKDRKGKTENGVFIKEE